MINFPIHVPMSRSQKQFCFFFFLFFPFLTRMEDWRSESMYLLA